MIDYKTLSEKEFEKHCEALYAEQNRRSNLKDIPEQIKSLAENFESMGGDRNDLIEKINQDTEE